MPHRRNAKFEEPSVAPRRRQDRLVRIVAFILVFLIHGSATVLVYYFLGYVFSIVAGPILGRTVATLLAIGLASFGFVGGILFWSRIIVRGDLLPRRRGMFPLTRTRLM